MTLTTPSFHVFYKGNKGHKLYEQAMEQVAAHRSDLVSELAIAAKLKFGQVVQWVADHRRPGQTFDEALSVLYRWNKGDGFETKPR